MPDIGLGLASDEGESVTEAVSTSRSGPNRSRAQPRNPYLVVSNEGFDAELLDEMRGSTTPDTVLLDSTSTGGRIALDPYLAPPIIDIDEIRTALRGSVGIY